MVRISGLKIGGMGVIEWCVLSFMSGKRVMR